MQETKRKKPEDKSILSTTLVLYLCISKKKKDKKGQKKGMTRLQFLVVFVLRRGRRGGTIESPIRLEQFLQTGTEWAGYLEG